MPRMRITARSGRIGSIVVICMLAARDPPPGTTAPILQVPAVYCAR
jgi:hypothetical protein